MTQSAGIQLQVGLDLAFFRQQLTTLGATAAGYKLPINVQFDRRSVQNELNALGRNISQRTYRLEVATNLSTEIKNAGTLAKALRGLDNAIQKNKGIANRAVAGVTGGTVDASKIQALVNKATKPALQALYSEMSKASIPMAAVGKDTVNNLRNAILSGVPQLTTDLARGIASGISPGMKESGSKGAKLFIDAWKDAAGIASPSKVFKALGEFSADGLEIGFLNGLKDFKTKAVAEIKSIVKSLQQEARVGMIATGGLLSPVAGPRTAATRTIPGVPSPRNAVSNQDPGRSNNRILNSLSLLTGDPKLYRSRMANLGASRLPSSLLGSAATQMNLESMAPSFKQSRLGGTKTGVANIIDEAFFGRGTLPKASSALNGLSNTIERLASAARAAAPSGILQSASGNPRFRAFGGVPSSQSMGIFPPTAQPTAYPPSGGFLEFSRRATAISAGLPGNVFGGRQPPGGPPSGPPGGPPSGPPRPLSGGGGMGGMSNFGSALGSVNLPGAGVVREIGSEFAMAAKQVLLFGTAYKALAFLTSFPSQVGEAVGALQSFNNTLKAISPTAEEAKASNQFILDIVDRYNVPLQSARDGFTKLYASMAPAGFKGDEIRALFTGVSQAAATFGMSADKVDRVNYAFAQMASKGQVMSEELKGQLGDVLPGAMGIFAKAAGFEGADAIQKFGKALEDGAYKGKPMRDLLNNVTIELQKEFGPGAEGAARTYQGAMNRMANSTKLLYESFEPVAINFLNSIVVPITNGLKTVTDGFNAFFTGTQAKTAGGSAFAKQLESLRPTFQGIAANIQQILPLLQSFANTALALGQVLLQIAGNPFVGYLARIYLSVLPVTMALRILNLQALIPLIGSFMRAIPAFIAFQAAMIRGIGTNRALIATMQLTGQTAGITAGRVRLVSAALATLGTAAILGGIGLLIERFLMMKSAIDGVKQSTQQMLVSISGMANSGAVKELENFSKNIQKQKSTFTELKQFVSGGLFGGGTKELTQEMAKKFKEVGMGSFVSKNLFGKPIITDFLKAAEIIDAKLQGLNKESASVGEKLPMARRIAADIAQQAQTAENATTAIDLSGGNGAGDKPKTQSLESYHSLQDQLAKNFTQDQLDRMEQEYQSKVDRINAEFNLREARANSYQKEAIRFEKQMSDIELKRQKALLDASAEVIKAQGSVAGGAGGQSATGTTGLLQGSTGISSGAHFDVRRQDGSYISPEQAKALFDPSVRRQLAMTSAYGPRRAPVPGASTFHKGVDLAGPANTPLNLAPGFAMTGSGEKGGLGYAASVRGPSGEMYDVGHLQRPKAGMGAPRKVTGDEKRDVIADQKAQLAIAQKSLAVQIAEAQAVRDAAVAWAEYTTSIAPIEEQKLQNSILAKKNDLVRLGMPDDVIEKEMKHFETQQKTALAVEVVEKMLADKKISVEAATAKIAELNKRMADYNKLLGGNIELQRQQKFDANLKQLKDQIEALRVIGDEERRLFELRKEYGDDKKAQEIFDLEKIKKNIEDTRALIDGFVTQTSSDYKGFLKAVISGEDAVDALKQSQEGLKDRVLTIFLDFAMAPVEKFLKESLEGLFLPKTEKEAGELPEATTKDPVEATNINTNATNTNTTELKNLTTAIQGMGAGTNAAPSVQGPTTGNAFSDGSALPSIAPGFDAGSVFGNPEALTGAFADIQSSISTSMEGITSSFQMGADSLANTLPSWSDSLTTALPAALTTSTEKTEGEIPNFQESLGKVAAGIGIAAGAIMGIAAGISQIKKGGTGNTLMGIGSIMASVGGAIGGFTKLAGANGGVAGGGWKPFPVSAFANGGMVKGPTLGLVGEGKYNEAIVPLPDGRSIPVQMRGAGGSGSRDLLANQAQSRPSPSVLSMSFQSTTINGVEYVDRAQLEAAMEETRRAASREGANKGANLAIDRLANSPSSRRRAGIR